MRNWIIAMLALLAACVSNDEPGLGDDRITIVIPYRPGGGFDRAVRAFAPYFERELGEEITVLPENVPGAGGRRGATTVYRAAPDGTTLGVFNLPGFVLPEILGERVAYDLRELSWIGRLESQQYVLLVAADSGIRTLADLQEQEQIAFLSTGYGSTVLAASQITADALGLMARDPVFLTGYAGTADFLVGLIRGDGNVGMAPVSSAFTYLQSGDLHALAMTGRESRLEGVATFAELGYPELTPLDLQRSLAAPPGMHPALLERLRAAFMRAVDDPRFREAARIARLDLEPLGGVEAAAEVERSFEFYERFKANLKNPNAF